jgi:hypothetical protein
LNGTEGVRYRSLYGFVIQSASIAKFETTDTDVSANFKSQKPKAKN